MVRAIVRLFHSLRAPDSEGVVVAGLFLPVARGSPHLVVSAQLYRWSVNGTHCSIRRHHQKEKRVSQRDGICDGPIESAEACRECIHQRSVKAGSPGAFLFRCSGSASVESERMLDPATIQQRSFPRSGRSVSSVSRVSEQSGTSIEGIGVSLSIIGRILSERQNKSK